MRKKFCNARGEIARAFVNEYKKKKKSVNFLKQL